MYPRQPEGSLTAGDFVIVGLGSEDEPRNSKLVENAPGPTRDHTPPVHPRDGRVSWHLVDLLSRNVAQLFRQDVVLENSVHSISLFGVLS